MPEKRNGVSPNPIRTPDEKHSERDEKEIVRRSANPKPSGIKPLDIMKDKGEKPVKSRKKG